MDTIRTRFRRSKTSAILAVLLVLALALFLVPLAAQADSYEAQGKTLLVHMLDPEASKITAEKKENGDYWNTVSTGFDAENVSFVFEAGNGGGTNNLTADTFQNYIKLYSDASLSEDSLLYGRNDAENFVLEMIGDKVSLQRGKQFKLTVRGLQPDTTYYLVFVKGLVFQHNGNTAELGDNNIVFEFKTLADVTAVDAVSLNQSELVFEGLKKQYRLEATVSPETATNPDVTWTSSNDKVVKAGKNGNVTPLAAGEATVTVTTADGAKTASCKVTVLDSEANRVLIPAKGSLQSVGDGIAFTVEQPEYYKNVDSWEYTSLTDYDRTALPELAITMVPNGERKITVFHVKALAEDKQTVVATEGNGITDIVSDNVKGRFQLDPASFEAGKTYYFVLEKTSTCGALQLGQDIFFELKIKAEEEPTPAEPEEPATEPEEPLNGIVKGKDGKWAMYRDDKVDTSYTGVAENEYGWWRVENGYVNFDAQGIYHNDYGWWKTTNGKVTFDETGIFKNEYGWWRVEKSKVNFKANGIYQNDYGWWKTTNGKVTFDETGVFKNDYGWWRVEKSKVNFKANGIYKNDYGWWKTTNGKVTFKETGIFRNEYGSWYVKNSKVDFTKTGKVTFQGKTYMVQEGKAKLA